SGFGNSPGEPTVANFHADALAAWHTFRVRVPAGARARADCPSPRRGGPPPAGGGRRAPPPPRAGGGAVLSPPHVARGGRADSLVGAVAPAGRARLAGERGPPPGAAARRARRAGRDVPPVVGRRAGEGAPRGRAGRHRAGHASRRPGGASVDDVVEAGDRLRQVEGDA